MNPDAFPHVSEELVEALRELFPINTKTLEKDHESVLKECGRQTLIDWLQQMHEAQTNKEPTE